MKNPLWLVLALPLALCGQPVPAAPPAGVNPNGPIGQWVQAWKNAEGYGCCGLDTDCRPTAVIPSDTGESGYKAWISKETFGPSAPDAWVDIPKDAFSPSGENNPSGVSWACWYNAGVRCASLGSGT